MAKTLGLGRGLSGTTASDAIPAGGRRPKAVIAFDWTGRARAADEHFRAAPNVIPCLRHRLIVEMPNCDALSCCEFWSRLRAQGSLDTVASAAMPADAGGGSACICSESRGDYPGEQRRRRVFA